MTTAINADQSLRVVPASGGCVYVHGEFIGVPDPHTGRAGLRQLEIITGMTSLQYAESEKGEPVKGGWDSKSVFGIIDKLAGPSSNEIPDMSRYFNNLELLVCTDLQTEPCDFIALQDDRLAFIHGKVGRGNVRSASVFHEVVGQAIKNVLYLAPPTQSRPSTIESWNKPWNHGTKTPVKRVRAPKQIKGAAIWERVRDLVANPAVQKEVWTVLGAGMSLSRVRAELQKDRPSDEMIQIYTLLQTAWTATVERSAQLRIFCSP